jgi:cell shape-determining protein MreC
MTSNISEKTTLSLGFIMLIIATLGGGIAWLSDIYSKAAYAVSAMTDARIEISDLKLKNEKLQEQFQEINRRLSRMEGLLEMIARKNVSGRNQD